MSVEIDLGRARDQGPRPLCLSFAVSELHRASRNFHALFSPESLHRRACARAKRPVDEAITIASAIDCLSMDGQSTEAHWPYGSEYPVDADCAYHRASLTSEPFDATTIQKSLEAGAGLGLVINVDMPFFMCRDQTPLDLSSGAKIEGRHAVVICGFRSSAGSLEYSIKNSWGEGWGMRGYAWLTSKYVLARHPALLRI